MFRAHVGYAYTSRAGAIWLCHQCGYVSYYDTCVNGCPWGGQHGDTGWSCLGGKCTKKGCGCKKPASFWKRKGFVMDMATLWHQGIVAPRAPKQFFAGGEMPKSKS